MDYVTLKSTVLDFADRADLTAQVASFIELAEGLIRRDLLAAVYTVTLADADRVAGAVYTLPAEADEVRLVLGSDSFPLEQVSLVELAVRARSSAVVSAYAVIGDGTIAFDNVPGASDTFAVTYFGHPAALSGDSDTNALLTSNSALYVYGALFHLHQYVQDVELAQGALDTFNDAIQKVNEAASRRVGGAAQRPVSRFGALRRGY